MGKTVIRRPSGMRSNPLPGDAEWWQREQEGRARAAYAALGPLGPEQLEYLRGKSDKRRARTLANWYGTLGARVAAAEYARLTQSPI